MAEHGRAARRVRFRDAGTARGRGPSGRESPRMIATAEGRAAPPQRSGPFPHAASSPVAHVERSLEP
ncbi:hypothetical protein DB32_003021 [Sandaracinus amylolyticus]|uniref:Uncharacterized protein n=1 Tax=Sandaracinus amylolyticus TaxID=927083 RepID=A0A0F6YI79_9BACT|nr:hypothetical protein DB32_003021 [Sandaracinus amylolyticus]